MYLRRRVALVQVDRTMQQHTPSALQAATAPQTILEMLWEKMLEEALHSTKGRTLASDPNNHHDVLELSKRLWGDGSASNLYVTHRLLREDDVYFYRLKTRPPTFHVRPKSEVDRLLKQKQLASTFSPSMPCILSLLHNFMCLNESSFVKQMS